MSAGKKSKAAESRGLVGLAEIKVTPPIGTGLAGYSASPRLSTGVHDDLHVRCVAAESGRTAVAILSVSVCGLDAKTAQAIRDACRESAPLIPPRNILIHATHTHSGPHVRGDYARFLVRQCARCVGLAWKRRFPARVGVGIAAVGECGRNRRYLDYGGLPVDPSVSVIKITDARDRLRAVVFNYACHGTCLDSGNTLVTEDWPHFAIQTIKRKTGRRVMGVFLGGAAGDINPGYSAGLSAVSAKIPVRTWSEAQRIGENVGNAASAILPRIRARPLRALRNRTAFVDLPLRKAYPVKLAEARKRLREARRILARENRGAHPSRVCVERAKVGVFFAGLVLEGAKRFYLKPRAAGARAELQAIVLGDAVLATFPGEVFVEAGLAVKRRSPFAKTLVVGLANAFEAGGYMPTRDAFAEGDYEVFETRYDESAADVLVGAALKNIRALRASGRAGRGR
ncbi:MAG: hypothetical protein GX608_06380 [Lentisphaerae bacterium]|nr:hypothetical protein [Lentisphaerota bacterium]